MVAAEMVGAMDSPALRDRWFQAMPPLTAVATSTATTVILSHRRLLVLRGVAASRKSAVPRGSATVHLVVLAQRAGVVERCRRELPVRQLLGVAVEAVGVDELLLDALQLSQRRPLRRARGRQVARAPRAPPERVGIVLADPGPVDPVRVIHLGGERLARRQPECRCFRPVLGCHLRGVQAGRPGGRG
jgi:hypothetical protein